MVKTILMFYGRGCLNAEMIMPVVEKINNRKEEDVVIDVYEIWGNEDTDKGKELHKKYSSLIKQECGRDTIVPSFVDVEGNKALCDPTPEGLMGWLFGPDWWKE